MTLPQQLSLEDYHLFLKETLYQNVVFKMIIATGYVLLSLVLYKFVTNDFVYTSSMNGLLFITVLVLNMRKITHISDKRRFGKNDYLPHLLEKHKLDFTESEIKITKGKDVYKLNMNAAIVYTEFPSFLVLTLTADNKFPIKITAEDKEKVDALLEIIKKHNLKFENN